MNPVFIGSGVALVTPFDKDGKIDFNRLEKLIEFHINNKSDAIIVCGTTGESATLTFEEKIGLFNFSVKKAGGRIPIICGTGSNSTFFAQDLSIKAESAGADALLIVTPYYNKTSQNGLIEHYFAIADKTDIPIIVYNVPSRTGMNILPETYKKLSEHPKIVGVKEADSNIAKIVKSIKLTEGALDFYIGNDDMIVPSIAAGCKGVVSVLANILPSFTHEMAYKALKGSFSKADEMQKKVCEINEALFSDVNPIPVKYFMNKLNIDSGKLRLPLTEISDDKKALIEKLIDANKDLFSKENFI